MTIIETERLLLRQLTPDDAAFMLQLLNEPSFHQFIGDRGVRTLDEARDYILKGAVASYQRNGFGLWATVLKTGGAPIGICGLVKRAGLDDIDLGYAFLPAHWGQGYAIEAALALLNYARGNLGLKRIVAIVSSDNTASIRLLEKLGMRYERMVSWRRARRRLRCMRQRNDLHSARAGAARGPAAGRRFRGGAPAATGR